MACLSSHDCELTAAAWGAPFSPNPAVIFYFKSNIGFSPENPQGCPDLVRGPAWYRWERSEPPRRILDSDKSMFFGTHPLTTGFFCGFGTVSARVEGLATRRGDLAVFLEARLRFRAMPPVTGKKVREIETRDYFSDRPIEVYVATSPVIEQFHGKTKYWFSKFRDGLLVLPPISGLTFSALLDNEWLFVRQIEYRPLKELVDVETLLYEQCRTLLRADRIWFDAYLESGDGYCTSLSRRPAIYKAA